MPWSLVTLLLLGFGLYGASGAAHEETFLSAQVVGTVVCDPCFKRGFSRTGHFISGASVLIECMDLSFRKEVTTDTHGKFKVRLPPSMSDDAENIQGCTVKLIKSGNPGCDVVSSGVSSSLRLKSKRQGLQVFSAGVFTFMPQEKLTSCARKPTWRDLLESGSKKGSIHLKSARRAPVTSYPDLYPPKTFVYPPPTVTPWSSISESAMAMPPPSATSPPVPGLMMPPPTPSFPFLVPPLLPLPPLPPLLPLPPLPPLPPIPFPPTLGFTPPPPIPSPPLPGCTPQPPLFPFPVPPSPPLPPQPPAAISPPFPSPPIPRMATFPPPPLPLSAPPVSTLPKRHP